MLRHFSSYWLALCTIPVVTVFAYWSVLAAGFVWDDYYFLLEDGRWLLEGNEWFFRAFQEFYVFQGDASDYATNYFRPLVMLGYVAQMRLSGGNPLVLHAFGLGVHVVNSILVFSLSRRWAVNSGIHARQIFPLLFAFVYALHPALVEPVSWISGQFDLLVTFFCLCALLADSLIVKPWLRALVVSLAFFGAALCKEAAVVLPVLLVVVQWYFIPGNICSAKGRFSTIFHQHWRTYFLILVAGVAYLFLRWICLGALLRVNPNSFGLGDRLQMFAYSYLAYWRLALLPFYGLQPLHEVSVSVYTKPTALLWFKLMVSSAIIFISVTLWFRRKWLGFSLIVFTIALFPVLHFLPMMIGESLYHERFLTLPLAVFCTALSCWSSQVFRENPFSYGIKSLSFFFIMAFWIFFAFLSVRTQSPLWSSNYSLWSWMYRKDPNSYTAMNQLFADMIANGMDGKQVDDIAKKLYSRPDLSIPDAINLSTYYIRKNDLDKASRLVEGVYKESNPGSRSYVLALVQYSVIVTRKDEFDAAINIIKDAIKSDPENTAAQIHLVKIYTAAGRVEDAQNYLDTALLTVSPLLRAKVRSDLEREIEMAELRVQ